MKFLVDDSQSTRHRRISDFLVKDSAIIAVLLAAADFEWTLRRTIYCLGSRPIRELKAERTSGLRGYAKLWKGELQFPGARRLEEVVGDWEALVGAFDLRNRIIHGSQGATGLEYATRRVHRMLLASVRVADFGSANGANVFARLKRVKRERDVNGGTG